MPAHRSFQVASADEADEPITFDLLDETFTAYPARLPASVVLDANVPTAKAGTNSTLEFFKAVLGDDYERFSELVHRPDVSIRAQVLTDIATWIQEEGAGRPT